MKVNNNNRLILNIIIIILVIIMILILILSSSNRFNNVNNQNQNQSTTPPLIAENVIIPSNSYAFFGKYVNGDIGDKEIYEKIYKFATVIIPDLYKLKNSDEKIIYNYYERNTDKINEFIDIKEKENFKDFINVCNELNTAELELKSMEFIKDEITYTDISTTAKLKISYSNNKDIYVNVKVYKKQQENNRNVVFFYNM